MERVFHLSFSLSPSLFFSLPLYFSISQSNWYDMSTGKCNLLLIKTCCWHRLQTDSDLRLSSSHFSSPSSIILFFFSVAPPTLAPSSFSCYLNTQLFPPTFYFLPPLLMIHSDCNILCFCFFNNFSSLVNFFLWHCRPSTMKRKRELSAGKSSSSTTTSWRQRSPSINSERTTWVAWAASCEMGCHWHLCQHCACRFTCTKSELCGDETSVEDMPELYSAFKQ